MGIGHLDVGLDLGVGLDVAGRADRLVVDGDPLDRRLQMRAGGAPGALPERGQQRIDHPRDRGLAVGAADVDGRIVALRGAEQLHQHFHPGRRGDRLALRPALIEQVVHLQQRRDLVEGRFGLGHTSAARRAVMRSTSSPASFGGPGSCRRPRRAPWPGMRRCRVWPTWRRVPSGRRPGPSPTGVARRPRPRFRRCPAPPARCRRRSAPPPARWDGSPPTGRSARTAPRPARPARSARMPRCRRAGRAPSAGRPALVAAEPTHLGDQLLQIGDPLRRGRIQCDAGGHRPVGDHQRLRPGQRLHSTSVTNGITGCRSLSRVSSTAASTAVVWPMPWAS